MAEPNGDETVELLQALIQNACVNEGTEESGQEVRNADLISTFLEGAGLDVERYDAAPGRTSLVARIEGSDPNAPSLCLNGHTDVVPVNEDGWSEDPFGGEVIDGEVWGRGAVDMLNLTSSMAVVMRNLAVTGFQPKGDLIYFAVADEEAGSAYGARWMADNHPDVITTDYMLTENGGLHGGNPENPTINMTVGEKGVAWRRLRVRGVPGHGSMPFRKDNALIKAAGIVQRLADYGPAPRFNEFWRPQVDAMDIEDEAKSALLDETQIDAALASMPHVGAASHLHACTHTTFSPNVSVGQTKTNVIPDTVDIDVDVRTLPGETAVEVDAHLRAALGDLYDHVEITDLINDPSSVSRVDTALWDALQRAVERPFPSARLVPQMSVGFTDARVHRELGAISYGAGLLSPNVSQGDFSTRFHGHNERIDIESLHLTTRFYHDVVTDMVG
ncbi:MAG: M20/M25/M40 family metallo-hydrolase [Acidimicrobiaceae bacterium]|jgi:acetylornithine deacetylase/succinyl-diaminopimelate desuccinylase-like protein|nr:M20/M25/M40 family metallo-hydrolase [Acidimicrobiaceae bacterium]